jgi:hypothetical protein
MLGPLGRGLVIGAGLLVVSFYVYPDYPLLSLALVLLPWWLAFGFENHCFRSSF